jgi:hypothetical protein
MNKTIRFKKSPTLESFFAPTPDPTPDPTHKKLVVPDPDPIWEWKSRSLKSLASSSHIWLENWDNTLIFLCVLATLENYQHTKFQLFADLMLKKLQVAQFVNFYETFHINFNRNNGYLPIPGSNFWHETKSQMCVGSQINM